MPYEKHTWLRGETITAENLNHLEDGIVGEQTTRASQDQLINERIDQVIAPTGEAPNPSEITDARIGEDGTVYNTLGTAIRTQVSDLKNAVDKKVEYISKYETPSEIDTLISFPSDGRLLDATTGAIINSPSSTYRVTEFIDLTGITGIYRTKLSVKFSLWRYAFYDENQTLLNITADTTDYSYTDHNGQEVTWLTLNPNAKYIRIMWDSSRAYEYYTVKNATVVESYTLPNIYIDGESVYDNILEGKTAYAIASDIAETESVNILNPEEFKANGYYLDFSDGVTHVVNSVYKMTAEKIQIGQIDKLYVKQTYSDVSTNGFFVYCYSDDAYLGYKAMTFAALANNEEVPMLYGTTAIRICSNAGDVTGEQICITLSPVDEFTPYDPYYVVKPSALPANVITENYYPLDGKKIVNFGDSIFGNKRPPYDISTSLAKITGATVYNLGFGGCRMSYHANGWDAFSMYRLAEAVATNDFTYQDSVDVDSITGMPQYFKETRTLLESIDFSKIDIVTIAYGTNDFTAGIPLDDAENEMNVNTFGGALRYSLETLMSAYPQLHIFVCTQTYRFWLDSNHEFMYDSDTHVINGRKLTDFVEKTQNISKAYHVKSIDNYYDLGIDKFNRSHWFPTNDGTHHNTDGGMLIAQHMANELF